MPCPRGQESYARLRAWLETQAGDTTACLRSLSQEEQAVFRLTSAALAAQMRSSSAHAESGCIPSSAAGAMRAYVRILNRLCLYPQTEDELRECEREVRELEGRPASCPPPVECPPPAKCPESPPCPACPEPPPRRAAGVSWGVTLGAVVVTGVVGYVAVRAMR